MPYSVTKFQTTPNPNAIKCVLDRKTGSTVRSYFAAAQAASDPLAAGLFAVPGVTNILINSDWITVNKTPEADWATVKAGVERVLRGAE
jgi:NFU1 iron-sulfur cluster scaffold homolog, mitochondrial